MIKNKFFGTEVIFWIGVVEHRDDSTADDGQKLGRCRVRVLGFHSEKKHHEESAGEGIEVNELLWAYPISPITSASMHGIGETPLGPVEGTWVFGFAMDGRNMQDLYILGTMVGVNNERLQPENQGFCDPKYVYPKDEFFGETDLNRLAKNEKIDETIVEDKKQDREKSIPTADGSTWDEPLPAYAAKYPFNHVKESESGHIFEVDDSPGNERIQQYHRKGTFYEIDKDGNKLEKIQGHDFEIVVKDKNVYIKGNCNVTVDGNAEVYVKGDTYMKTDGNTKIETGKNMQLIAGQNIDIKAGGTIKTHAGENITSHANQNFSMTCNWTATFSTRSNNPRSTLKLHGEFGASMTANIAKGNVRVWGRNSVIPRGLSPPNIAQGVS